MPLDRELWGTRKRKQCDTTKRVNWAGIAHHHHISGSIGSTATCHRCLIPFPYTLILQVLNKAIQNLRIPSQLKFRESQARYPIVQDMQT
jgi:hypothetical protein